MSAYKRKEVIGDATLYLGDCLEILPTLEKVDAVITDPPYGVMLGQAGTGDEFYKKQMPYSMFTDSPEYISSVVVPAIKVSLSISSRALITPGNRNSWMYPPPSDVGVWYNPAGTGRGKWGFILAHLILYYGKDPNAGRRATASSVWGLNTSVADLKNKEHPCPKPLAFGKWAISKASVDGDSVLDPFMGAGTFGVSCQDTNRKFIGIEIEPKYFDIACERIENAQRQARMFA